MGSWADAADHIGTRTRQEAERHYNEVYVNSPDWPMPVRHSATNDLLCTPVSHVLGPQNMNAKFEYDVETFQEKKKRRLQQIQAPVGPFILHSALCSS